MNLYKIKDLKKFKSFAALTIVLCFNLVSLSATACDICGCFMGITPYDNQSTISVLYRYRSFAGHNGQRHPFFPSGSKLFRFKSDLNAPITNHDNNPTDFEVYRTLELRGRYFLSRRVEVNAILPYNSTSEQYNNNLNNITGLGDVNVYAGYHLIRKLDTVFSQRFIIGAGAKLPTGNYQRENFEGFRFNTLSQPGTGSTDGFAYFNYLVSYKKAGASLVATYKVNGQNANDESIANSTTSFLNLFYNVSLTDKIKMVPSLQFAYEYSAGEKYKGVKTGEHEMNNLMSGAGLDVFFKNITLNMAIQTKAWAAKDDHAQPSGRLVMGLTYNFNQLYYLIN